MNFLSFRVAPLRGRELKLGAMAALFAVLALSSCAATYYTELPGRQPVVYTTSSSGKEALVQEARERAASEAGESGASRRNVDAEADAMARELVLQHVAEMNRYAAYGDVQDAGASALLEDSEAILAAAREGSARSVSSRAQMFGVVTVYTYIDGLVYDVYYKPDKATIIRLEEGESIVNCLLGDPALWAYETLGSVEGGKSYSYVLFRPYSQGIETDAHVFTDRRVYHFRLVGSAGESMVQVQFRYPGSGSASGSGSRLLASSGTPSATEFSRGIGDLNFNYVIKGDASWRPVRAFSDTERTYIQFDNSFRTNSETPVVYLRRGGKDELLDFTAKGVTYIVPVILSTNEVFVLKVEGREVLVGY